MPTDSVLYRAVFMTRYCDHRPISCTRLAMAVAAPSIGQFVARCALVRNSLQTSYRSVVSYDPLSHSRHNAEDNSAKVGHEINLCLATTSVDLWRNLCASLLYFVVCV